MCPSFFYIETQRIKTKEAAMRVGPRKHLRVITLDRPGKLKPFDEFVGR
jgi:hypothetical protein